MVERRCRARVARVDFPINMSVLLLGSGFVAKPCLDLLVQSRHKFKVTVACRTLSKAKELIRGVSRADAISLDVENEKALDAAVGNSDIVISLIPYVYHALVIKSAIRNKKSVVTTSYVSPAMLKLDEEAKKAGITVMNEIGLDPGIDHLYAIKTIDEVHAAGGKILSFLSYCGGLPAPEDSDNPLGYKFAWSPRGFLLAVGNSARFYEDGNIQDIEGSQLMKSAKPYFIYPGYAFVAYPNRDSTTYKERYGIPEAKTILRGTLRYQGFPQFIRVLADIGLLSEQPSNAFAAALISKWKDVLAKHLGASSSSEKDLIWAISSKTTFDSTEDKDRIMNGLRWLGLFSSKDIKTRGNPLDTLCATFEEKMQYEKSERDFVLLQHKFDIEHKDGSRETKTSTLIEYGNPDGYTAMGRLVGVPCAVATEMVYEGTIKTRGILAPMDVSLASTLRKALQKYGINMIEKTIA